MRPHRDTDEWTVVRHKKQVHAVRLYWDGFDRDGAKNWYIQLSDGRHLPAESREFAKWRQRIALVVDAK